MSFALHRPGFAEQFLGKELLALCSFGLRNSPDLVMGLCLDPGRPDGPHEGIIFVVSFEEPFADLLADLLLLTRGSMVLVFGRDASPHGVWRWRIQCTSRGPATVPPSSTTEQSATH